MDVKIEDIGKKIESYMPFKPTSDQAELFGMLGDFILNSKSGELFIINGYAGTGKTTVITLLSRLLGEAGIKSVLLAPTGRAAKVMSSYSGIKAYTIHKKIYRQKSALVDQFVIDYNQDKFTYYIVDEASMINDNAFDSIFGSGNLLADLVEYVNSGRGCRLIIVGDKAQLPPIGRSQSPALEAWVVDNYSERTYFASLEEVVRQQMGSAILDNATTIRNLIESDLAAFPMLDTSRKDFISITGADFYDQIESAYSMYGQEETIVITRSNKQAVRINNAIRNRVLYMEEELSSGDMIMVVKNNYHYTLEDKDIDFIANGDICKVRRLRRYEELYDMRYVTATVRFPDFDDAELECKVLLDTLNTDIPALSSEQNKALFFKIEEDYADITVKKERYKKVKEDSYFNALQIKFAYAVTCHKAQGGQWDAVFIDQMLFGDQTISVDLLRWLYTAITRAKERVVLINFDERFF
ncbi:MAG: AAA family ATPase [Rikenellaceae bacterium]